MDRSRDGEQRRGRIGAALLFMFALLYGVAASRIEYAFSSDPLGPQAIPLGLAVVLAGLAVLYFLRPGAGETWPRGALLARLALLPALVAAAALSLELLGFPVAIFVMTAGIARAFGAGWRSSIVGGLAQSALWYVLFGHVLEVYLPLGAFVAP